MLTNRASSFARRTAYHLHEYILALWGMPLGEMLDLEKLAATCREKNRWFFFFTSAPANCPGACFLFFCLFFWHLFIPMAIASHPSSPLCCCTNRNNSANADGYESRRWCQFACQRYCYLLDKALLRKPSKVYTRSSAPLEPGFPERLQSELQISMQKVYKHTACIPPFCTSLAIYTPPPSSPLTRLFLAPP